MATKEKKRETTDVIHSNMKGIEYLEDIDVVENINSALEVLKREILQSPEYKLLYGKTQMFFDDKGRSRGGHSKNIGEISSEMAETAFKKAFINEHDAINGDTKLQRIYNCNLNITKLYAEIMGLSHDLGHTPLGHGGERLLNKKLQERLKMQANKDEKDAVYRSRKKIFKGTKIAGKDYEAVQEEDRQNKQSEIGFEHNEYSAEIFSRLYDKFVEGVKKQAESSNEVTSATMKKALKGLGFIKKERFVTAILAHSKSRFLETPDDFLAQIVRQADKIEYINYDYDDFLKMGYFPIEDDISNEMTEEEAQQYMDRHENFKEVLIERAKKAGIDSEKVLRYMQMSSSDRRRSLENNIIDEGFDKNMIMDNIEAIKMAKICAQFKDDILFYSNGTGINELLTGNNVEVMEAKLSKIIDFYVKYPEKIPQKKVSTEINPLKGDETIGNVKNRKLSTYKEVVAFDPANFEKCGADKSYQMIKSYISSFTNAEVEKQYKELVERGKNGPKFGIKPVTRADIINRLGEKKQTQRDIDTESWLTDAAFKRIEESKKRFEEELEQYEDGKRERVVDVSRIRVSKRQIRDKSPEKVAYINSVRQDITFAEKAEMKLSEPIEESTLNKTNLEISDVVPDEKLSEITQVAPERPVEISELKTNGLVFNQDASSKVFQEVKSKSNGGLWNLVNTVGRRILDLISNKNRESEIIEDGER